MSWNSLASLLAFSLLLFGSAASSQAKPVEYVKICSLYGTGYYYIPGTDTCLHASTGATRRATENGTVVGKSEIAARLDALESDACDDCFAVLSKLGDPVRTFGVQASTKFGVGSYAVVFRRPIGACAFNATIGDAESLKPGMITVAKGQSNSVVLVRTFNFGGIGTIATNHGGVAADRGFHLSIECPTG